MQYIHKFLKFISAVAARTGQEYNASDIGKDIGILPEKSLNTLVTAEILYQRYANEEYAKRGFDYSSVSALFYQSVEITN